LGGQKREEEQTRRLARAARGTQKEEKRNDHPDRKCWCLTEVGRENWPEDTDSWAERGGPAEPSPKRRGPPRPKKKGKMEKETESRKAMSTEHGWVWWGKERGHP